MLRCNRVRRGFAVLLSLAVIFCLTAAAFAAPARDFSVRAVIPKNQVDKKQTYYDLYMEPGQQQTLQLAIDNSGSSDMVARVSFHTATTGRNGTVIYNLDTEPDDSMQLSIADIARVRNPEVVVPAGGRAMVDIQVDMPEDALPDGILLGGVVVTADTLEEEDAEESNPASGVSLETAYEYVVGLKISQSDVEVHPDFHLKSVQPELVNHRTALVVNLQNSEAALAKNMKVLAQVYKGSSDEVYRELVLDNAEMAPNSNGEYVVDWESTMDKGDYSLYMRVEHNGKLWEWTEAFRIDGPTAEEVNGNAVNITRRPVWLFVSFALAAIALVIWLAFWLGRRSRREDSPR